MIDTPEERLQKAMYTFNFLNCFAEDTPPIARHFASNHLFKFQEKPPVLVRNMESGKIEGLFPLITWGSGYACVSTDSGPKWFPAKNMRPYIEPSSDTQTSLTK